MVARLLSRSAALTVAVLVASLSVLVTPPLTSPSSGSSVIVPSSATVPYSIRLADQLLATLRYLPVAFVTAPTRTTTGSSPTTTTSTTTTSTTTTTTTTTTTGSTSTTSPSTTTTSEMARVAKKKKKEPARPALPAVDTIQSGTFVWKYPALTTLKPLWSVGTDNVVFRGALMRFQNVVGLETTGAIDGPTWTALLQAAWRGQHSPTPYDNVVVSQKLPEGLTLYQNGRATFHSLVNTGVASAPSKLGTYPVYLRFTSTTMSGTYPDGQTYSDPGVPWVSYFDGGEALHGFPRATYGWPQSLGCVEMPINYAEALWPHTPIGTLVTVL